MINFTEVKELTTEKLKDYIIELEFAINNMISNMREMDIEEFNKLNSELNKAKTEYGIRKEWQN